MESAILSFQNPGTISNNCALARYSNTDLGKIQIYHTIRIMAL